MKNGDDFYFDNFIACADCAARAADMLCRTLTDFDPEKLDENRRLLHEIEHSADVKKHELTEKMVQAFITPIEREDILLLSGNIDDVTDSLEDVLQRVYMGGVTCIRPEAVQFSGILREACDTLRHAMEDFRSFKRKNSPLPTRLIRINELEEEADELFISAMRALFTHDCDPGERLAWSAIYEYMEKSADACEHAADVVESVVMKNT